MFWKRVIIVLTGSATAQAFPILAAPLITRLCSPAEMGLFSVCLGVIGIAAVAATLRFEAAVILDHQQVDQQTCLSVVAYVAGLLALAVVGVAFITRTIGIGFSVNLSWFGVTAIGVGIWLTAYMQTVLAYATSRLAFGAAARTKIWSSGGIVAAQLTLLYFGTNHEALLTGQIIGLAIGVLAAVWLIEPPSLRMHVWPDASQLQYLKKRRAFWKYALPADLLNTVSGYLPLFLIGTKYGAAAAGLFALTQRVLGAPTALLAASVLEVFKQQSAHEFRTSGNCRHTYQQTLKILVLLASGPTILLLAFAPMLFALVFGEAWRGAGELAKVMAALYFFRFIASPLSYVFYVVGRQKVDLVWQIALFIMTMASFQITNTLEQSLLSYTIGYSMLYIIYLVLSYYFSRNRLGTT